MPLPLPAGGLRARAALVAPPIVLVSAAVCPIPLLEAMLSERSIA